MKIAVTAHRPNKLNNEYSGGPLSTWISYQMEAIVNNYSSTSIPDFISGMALGGDTIWAWLAIKLGAILIAAIPCKNQDAKWLQPSKDIYNRILSYKKCTKACNPERPYDKNCMQDRNIWMVNNCDLLIAVWNGTEGGTYNCLKYAISKKKEIIIIDPVKKIVYNYWDTQVA